MIFKPATAASAFLIFLLATLAAAQTVTVSPETVRYRRPKPSSPEKRYFSITRPRISGTTPGIRSRIEGQLDHTKIFGFTIAEERNESQWLSEAGYEIDFNGLGVLAVTMTIDGVGAYPSSDSRRLSFNLANGQRISMSTQAGDGRDALLARLNSMLAAEIAEHKKLYKDPQYEVEDPEALFEGVGTFDAARLEDFSVGKDGLTFYFTYGFPHVIRALEPPGRFFLPWNELRPYINASGVFRKFLQD